MGISSYNKEHDLPKNRHPFGWLFSLNLFGFGIRLHFCQRQKLRFALPLCRAPTVHRTVGIYLSNPSSSAKKSRPLLRSGFWQRMRDSNPIKKSSLSLWRNHFLFDVAIFIAIFGFWGCAEMRSECVLIAVFIPL